MPLLTELDLLCILYYTGAIAPAYKNFNPNGLMKQLSVVILPQVITPKEPLRLLCYRSQ